MNRALWEIVGWAVLQAAASVAMLHVADRTGRPWGLVGCCGWLGLNIAALELGYVAARAFVNRRKNRSRR